MQRLFFIETEALDNLHYQAFDTVNLTLVYFYARYH